MRSKIKKYFLTGLIAILPIWISIFILWFLFKAISSFSKPLIMAFFAIVGLQYSEVIGRIFGFLLTLSLIYLVGILITKIAIGKKILFQLESVILKVPVLKGIYSAISTITRQLLVEKAQYKSVVLIEFPRKGLYSLGFATSELNIGDVTKVSIFVPTTPNPTSGYLVLLDKSQVNYLDISIEEGMKLIISGGVLSPEKMSLSDGKKDR